MNLDPLRHHNKHEHLSGAFGGDLFGQLAERFARFFGTPKFIIGQTVLVLIWITLNSLGWSLHWDVYPFILLNLAFSTQAAYAAPLILLAQTRQADRDKANMEADAEHRQEIADYQTLLLKENTVLTQQVHDQTARIEELHKHVTSLTAYFNLQAGSYEPEEVKPKPPTRRRGPARKV